MFFLNFISLHYVEGVEGQKLLESLGVSPDKIITTGDEAIELANKNKSCEIGKGLGINLRVARYSGVKEDFINVLGPILQKFARHYSAPIMGIPIAVHSLASDQERIRELTAGFEGYVDEGSNLDSPMGVIRQVSRCRVVVTGAYHAAVFALAQGIPSVCLVASPYYAAKFLGLEDLFGVGCKTVFLNDRSFPGKIEIALEAAWESAEVVRKHLLEAAMRQVEAGRNAYKLIPEVLKNHRPL